MKCNPQCLLNGMWMDEAYFSLHGDMDTQNSCIWVTTNPCKYHSEPLHSSYVTVWCDFTGSFILKPFSFWRTLSCIRRKNQYCYCRKESHAFAWPHWACIAGKTCITWCHLHAGWCPATHCMQCQDVSAGIFHRRPSDNRGNKIQ